MKRPLQTNTFLSLAFASTLLGAVSLWALLPLAASLLMASESEADAT